MTELEIALSVLLAVFMITTIIGFYLANKFYRAWRTKQTRAYEMGGRQVKGDMYQLLGTFAVLDDYNQIIMLSTTSKQASLDLLGIKNNVIDFIEFKKKGSGLQGQERKIKNLVDEKKVQYVIKDVELPEGLEINDRPERK